MHLTTHPTQKAFKMQIEFFIYSDYLNISISTGHKLLSIQNGIILIKSQYILLINFFGLRRKRWEGKKKGDWGWSERRDWGRWKWANNVRKLTKLINYLSGCTGLFDGKRLKVNMNTYLHTKLNLKCYDFVAKFSRIKLGYYYTLLHNN